MTRRPLVPTLAVLLAGCLLAAPSSAPAGVGQYFKDRAHDLADIFRVRVGMPTNGQAYGAKARVTSLAQAGYVHFDGDYVGLDRRGFGWMEERRTEGGVSLLYTSRHESIPRWGNPYLMGETLWSEVENRRIVRNEVYWDDGRGDLLGVSAEVATPLFAIDLGVNPSQAVDFVAGFLTIDIFNDDEQGIDRYWRYNVAGPTDPPIANLDAATRVKKAQLEAINERAIELSAAIAEAESFGLNDPPPAQAPPAPEGASWGQPAPAPGAAGPTGLGENEPLTAHGLNQILREGEKVDWDPGIYPPPADADR
jgi:hypothetical protein